MRTEEDEAFDELAKRQGDWGGGFKAKQAMAADKLHWSDCAVHNAPAYPAGKCDCGAMNDRQRLEAIVSVINKYLPPLGMHIMDAMSAIISLVDPLPAQPAQESEILTIVYQSGYYDGKKAALAGREWNFCERCGKRTADLTVIHTCTPPQEGR